MYVYLTMAHRTPHRKRTYVNGKPLSLELRSLVIDKIKKNGGNEETATVPYGTFATVASDLNLHKTTVSKTWRNYLLNGTLETVRPTAGPHRLLSSEDVEYIRQLVLLKPTLYKREIRDLVLENTNSHYPNLSTDTVFRTVRTRISSVKFTNKRTQRSNKRRWSDTNMLYTRNFFTFMRDIDVFRLRFIDEAHVNRSNGQRYFGTSESGSRCVDISSHPQGSQHTIFALVGLNENCFTSCIPAPTDGIDFINFIHEACIAHNNQGQCIITPGTIILTDCASVHSGFVQTILKPYLEDLGVQYLFIPKFSADLNPVEFFFSLLKRRLQDPYFQTLLDFNVPTAVLSAAETIPHDVIYSFFKNLSCNYMNL